jgi:ABC-type sugar transport system permease subunit
MKRKNRKAWLVVFKYYLLFALFIIAPIVLTINALFFRVFFLSKAARKMNYYKGL